MSNVTENFLVVQLICNPLKIFEKNLKFEENAFILIFLLYIIVTILVFKLGKATGILPYLCYILV